MAIKVAIHQPNYLPWIGFFQKMASADVFVILDNVQFSRDSYTQRTKIRTKDGWLWMTIPIEKKFYFKSIKDIPLPQDTNWQKKHWMSIVSNYSKSKYYNEYKDFFEKLYSNNLKNLQAFNEKGILYLKDVFDIDVELFKASEFELGNLKNTELIIEIVKKVGGDCYLSGMGGEKYMDESKFRENDIRLEYFKFEPFEYEQRWDGFEPYLSAIDLLFNVDDEKIKEIFD
jgi:hypothetical protein